MSENVVRLVAPVGDGLRVAADQVLTEALGKYETVVLVGETSEGEIRVCGTDGAGESVLLLEWAKTFLVNNRTVRS